MIAGRYRREPGDTSVVAVDPLAPIVRVLAAASGRGVAGLAPALRVARTTGAGACAARWAQRMVDGDASQALLRAACRGAAQRGLVLGAAELRAARRAATLPRADSP